MEHEMTCLELVEIVTEYFDDALSLDARRRFETHLTECEGCTAYVEQMRLTIHITGKLTEESLSSTARDTLLAAFRHWKTENNAE